MRYRIAGLEVSMDCLPDGRTLRQSRDYLSDETGEPDVVIRLSDSMWQDAVRQYPVFSEEEREYMMTASVFYTRLLSFDGMMLHASAIAMDGFGYAFSAPSGTGKSTHTGLWIQHFGADRVTMVNDDKPALRRMEDGWYLFGTPWSGKTDLNRNMAVPLRALCLLTRDTGNHIRQLSPGEALPGLLSQTLRPARPDGMATLLTLLDRLLREIPVFKLGCTVSEQAVQVAYDAMHDSAV